MANSRLIKCIEQLTHFIEEDGCPRSSWTDIVITEYSYITITPGKKDFIPRSALCTPENYEARFEELMDRGYSWLNMNAAGILERKLVIVIEFPNYTTNIKGKTSVHYTGACIINNKPNWDASKRFISN